MLKWHCVPVDPRLFIDILIPLGIIWNEKQDFLDQLCVFLMWHFVSKKLFYKEGITLRRKNLDECFVTDTFFSTKKTEKIVERHYLLSTLLTAKECVFVVLINCEDYTLLSSKYFANQIESPYEIIIYVTRKKKKKRQSSCNIIWTIWRVLEEETKWDNMLELHIRLLKVSVRRTWKK